MMPGRAAAAVVFARVLFTLNAVAAATMPSFDLQRDFSAAANPGANWSFGFTSDPAGALTLLDTPGIQVTDDGVLLDYWSSSSGAPVIYHNGTDRTGSFESNISVAPGEVVAFPALDPEPLFFVARLTVPAETSGVFRVESQIAPYQAGGPGWKTSFSVLLNRAPEFEEAAAGANQAGLTNHAFLAPGDMIDFVVSPAAVDRGVKMSARFFFVQSALPPPSIDRQPRDTTARLGSNATFSVTADPIPAHYQWHHDGVPLVGETNRALRLNGVQAGHAGQYHVVLSNAMGGVTSATATLFLDRAPLIVSQSLPQRLPEGWTATLTVEAEGEGLVGYQWFHDGAAVAGRNSSVIQLQHLAIGDAGAYAVVVSNAFGAVTSSPVALVVTSGAAFDLERDFSTNANPNFAWSYGYTPSDGSGSFVLAPLAVEVTSDNGTPLGAWLYPDGSAMMLHNGTASAATLGSAIVLQPGELAVFPSANCDVETANLRLVIPPGGPGTYRLEAFAESAYSGPGAGPARFHVTVNGAYFVTADVPGPGQAGTTNLFSLNTGDVVELIAGESGCEAPPNNALKLLFALHISTNGIVAPAISAPPEDVIVREGTAVSLTVTATGTPLLRYQWLRNEIPVADATGPTLDLAGVFLHNAGQYRVVVSNNAGSATSAVAAVTIDYTPRILDGPYDATVRYGQDVTLSVMADGGEPLFYQWSREGAALPGATNASLVLSSATEAARGTYRVVVTNAHGMAISPDAVLDVLLDPYLVSTPRSVTALAGFPVTLNVVAGGQPPVSYQWRRDGVALEGATTPILIISNVSESATGAYDVTASNGHGSVTSSGVRVFVRRDAVFDVRRDFSLATNPNNVWTYGWNFAWPVGEVILLDEPGVAMAGGGQPLEFWRATFAGLTLPAIFRNPSAGEVSNGGLSTYEPGGLTLIGSQNADLRPVVVRCTVPVGADGRYRIEAFARSHSDRQWFDVVTFRVMVRSNEVFTRQLAAASDFAAYTNQVELHAGDTVDFGVTRDEWVTPGATGVQLHGVLSLEAPLTAPPGPHLRHALSGGQLHLGFETVTARRYRLLQSSNLVDWEAVLTGVGTGIPLQYDVPVNDASRAFYRVASP